MNVTDHRFRSIERPVGSALPNILEREGQLAIDEALRGEGDRLPLDLRLEDVARGEARLFSDQTWAG